MTFHTFPTPASYAEGKQASVVRAVIDLSQYLLVWFSLEYQVFNYLRKVVDIYCVCYTD